MKNELIFIKPFLYDLLSLSLWNNNYIEFTLGVFLITFFCDDKRKWITDLPKYPVLCIR